MAPDTPPSPRTRVLAAIAADAAAPGVLSAAAALGALFGARVEAVHAGENDAALEEAARAAGTTLRALEGPPVEALAHAAGEEDVALVVLGARGRLEGKRPAGSTALRLITELRKPVAVVPPEPARRRAMESVMVPLDGTRESATALNEIVALASGAALQVVVAHVQEARTLPAFSDHLHHEAQTWAQEFIARNCPGAAGAKLELRVGDPHEHLLDLLRSTRCDLVALGWSQELSAGRAAVVRTMLAESPVPVLLAPLRPGGPAA